MLDMVEVNEEDKMKAEIYFNEQQQILNQPQIYYNGMFQQAVTTQLTESQIRTVSNNLPMQATEHQIHSMSQSPKLKPITIIDKQLITNQQILGNQNSGALAHNAKLKAKNAYDKIAKDHQTRYRSQH